MLFPVFIILPEPRGCDFKQWLQSNGNGNGHVHSIEHAGSWGSSVVKAAVHAWSYA